MNSAQCLVNSPPRRISEQWTVNSAQCSVCYSFYLFHFPRSYIFHDFPFNKYFLSPWHIFLTSINFSFKELKSFSVINLVSKENLIWFLNSSFDPIEISKNRAKSFLDLRPNPSAMFDEMDMDDLTIWSFIAHFVSKDDSYVNLSISSATSYARCHAVRSSYLFISAILRISSKNGSGVCFIVRWGD